MEKDKILRIDGDFDLLLTNHHLLEKGAVIWANKLPTPDQISELCGYVKCKTCGSSNIKKIGYEAHKNNGAFYYRCLDCLAQNWLFISTEKTTSADIVIVYGTHKKHIYKKEIESLTCPICKSETHSNAESEYFRDELPLIFPLKIFCTNQECNFVSNMIFWNCPDSFFQHTIGLAKSVLSNSGEAAVILAVAALETYLEKAFYFSNEENRFLCKDRKINFQNLTDVKKSYKYLLNINLPTLVDNPTWEKITDAIKKRHRIIHYGGFDEYYEQIEVTEDLAKEIVERIESLVKAVDKKILDDSLI